MVVANNQINDSKNTHQTLAISIPNADLAEQCRVHRPMAHIPGFSRSHWMTPLGKYLRRIALAATMVNEFFENTEH